MPTDHLIVLSVPGLRPGDVDKNRTPTLYEWANGGVMAELVPTFPCVTSPVQANVFTGTPPGQHGIIGNGFYWRDRSEVEFWVGTSEIVAGEHVWDDLKRNKPGMTSAVWHAQNIKSAGADFIVTPAPIHEADGTTRLWCYSKPDGLYESMLEALGHFPLQHYWGPLANIESTKWTLQAALWLIERHAPNLHWIYIPHLDYASQKFGPDSEQARAALAELDAELASFAARMPEGATGNGVKYLVVGEYAMTPVSGVVYPNRLLREAGLLHVREADGGEVIDMGMSPAIAVVDHQFAHVYVKDGDTEVIARCQSLFDAAPGVAGVLAGRERVGIGMDHERSGDIVLISHDDQWFAYYWWLSDDKAPAFAHTVDIHQKPGYDPVELFFDPKTRRIPLDASLVQGSHGVPATGPQHRTALISSDASEVIKVGQVFQDTDVKSIMLRLLGVL